MGKTVLNEMLLSEIEQMTDTDGFYTLEKLVPAVLADNGLVPFAQLRADLANFQPDLPVEELAKCLTDLEILRRVRRDRLDVPFEQSQWMLL